MKRLVLLCGALIGCTDAQFASLGALGSPAEIVCYSGGKEVYRGRSTGKIVTMENSDGWQFMESGSRNLIRVSGSCVIRN